MKEQKQEWVRKYYKENRERCDFNNKMYKLCAKGIVEWKGIEIKQHKRDYYKNNYYMTHREACIERIKNAGLCQRVAQAK